MFNYYQEVPANIAALFNTDKKYIYSTDDRPHTEKPPKKDYEWVTIYEQIPKNNTEGSILDLTYRIIYGQTIAPGHFFQSKENNNFICAQSIFIDVDGKGMVLEKDQAIRMLNDHGLHVNLVYDTLIITTL